MQSKKLDEREREKELQVNKESKREFYNCGSKEREISGMIKKQQRGK